MNNVNLDPIIDELVEEIVGAGDALDEDKRWRLEVAGGDEISESEKLSRLGRGEKEGLLDEGCRGVLETDDAANRRGRAEASGDDFER